jgi:alpha-L-rhamnosidase
MRKTTLFCRMTAVLLVGISRAPAIETFENAEWIGYTEDQRPAGLAERDVLFLRTPADLSKFVPSPKDPKPKKRRTFPAPLLRKSFTVEKPVKSAQVAVCGLGLHEIYLNGKKVGDHVLDPAQTTYDKRSFYVVHDVSESLRQGDNAIGVMLGSGFFGQNIAFGGGLAYGEPRVTLALSINYTDGTLKRIVTDQSWKADQGPVMFDNLYAGETYDARLEQADWNSSGFDDASWKPVRKMSAPTTKLIEQEIEPMRKIRAVQSVAALPAENGEWIIDMGQNMTGWLKIRVNETAGTKIQMRFAELLMPDGKAIDTASTGGHVTGGDQTDIYVCKGGGSPEEWEPRFTYHGFRYVQISGLGKKPELKDFTGWLVRTAVARIGKFECSDPLINKFYNVSMWTIEDNLQGLLSDCPHRERCAWMGDGHAVGEAASFNFDLKKFWRKTSADMETVLGANKPREDGGLPRDPRAPCNISVGKRLCQQARPDWGAATVLVPWISYLHYGDLKVVETAWPMMEGWMAFLDEFAVKDGIIKEGYGDWCPPGTNSKIDTPEEFTSTALYHQSLEVMAVMAKALGKPADASRYESLAIPVKAALIKRFFNSTEHHFGTQTATAMALNLGLVPEGEEPQAADALASLIMKKAGGHYTTGIFGHRPLYTVLNDYGYGDVTRHLWRITDWPSLGFLTEKHNLTTWPEVPYNWEPGKRYLRNSFNHPMHSGFAAAYHESIGGIRPDPANPGFKRFFLRPCFLPDLEWAKVTLRSPMGLISSHWKRDGDSVVWEIVVPAGSTALVQLPGSAAGKIKLDGSPAKNNEFELSPGNRTIRITL